MRYYDEVVCPNCGEIITLKNIEIVKYNCGICPACKKSADMEKYEEHYEWINPEE